MITIPIPGWGNLDVEAVVLDLNGTLATDGRVPPPVKDKIKSLTEKVDVYVLTADTQGTADEQMGGLDVKLVKVAGQESQKEKFEFLKTLNLEKTVVLGNGSNDRLILKEAALGVAVLGEEGLSASAIKHADLVVKNILDALDLFMKPKRLIATLRE